MSPVGQTGYGPLSQGSAAQPNLAVAALVGVLLALACGFGFGYASVAAGLRIPYLTLAIGYINGFAVLKAAGAPGQGVGIIAGASGLIAAGLATLIMFLAQVPFSIFAVVLIGYAAFRAYAIALGR